MKLPREPGAAASGRHRLAKFLGARGWGKPGEATPVDDAILMTNELITNAIKHGEGAISLTINYDEPDRLSVTVEDEGIFPLAPRGFDGNTIKVRGLGLVARLADRWGIESGPTTRVWFELVRTGA
ncbi:MAG: ATP-binding protein [Acidimicrobiia bacterium]|nr:ATP-binding protein [Acidimicrobiia bacterium]NNF09068.1 ATP-binding protein [Acidimicrobiia bacterium]NNL71286.1 ATP-binding protein [Acidimicrobiia bacterium]